jgi:hypothetical protein
MSLWIAIKNCARQHPRGSATAVARQFISELDHDELISLVAKAILDARRQLVHGIERVTFRGDTLEAIPGFESQIMQQETLRPFAVENVSREAFRKLLDSTFALGDGVVVTWGRATYAQHAQRREMLLKFAAGTIKTAHQHELAMAVLAREGASYLDDVDDLSQLFESGEPLGGGEEAHP